MSPPRAAHETPRFAIIGGGITGLTAAYRLSQLAPQATVELFEASDRLGGVLYTKHSAGYLSEGGADSFITTLPWAIDLCTELGLDDELIPTEPNHRRALVWHDGRLPAVPEGFVVMKPQKLGPVLQSPLLSLRGKVRLLLESWVPSPNEIQQADYDESVASFATRRLGREVFERLVQPLLAGIYTADPARLSLAATMPKLIEAERKYGSLRCAIRHEQAGRDKPAQESGARYASFVTLKQGMNALVDALAKCLPAEHIHLMSHVESLSKKGSHSWLIQLAQSAPSGRFDGVVVALPAPRAANLLCRIEPNLGKLLDRISYASSSVVCMGFRRDQIAQPLEGFGVVVPTVEEKNIVAASFSSIKFPGRAPADEVLIRVFLGGALQPEVVELPDEQLVELARRDLYEMLGIRGEPLHIDIVRWREKMPQYHVGHVQLVDEIEQQAAQIDGLELAGNAYHGVGIPQCIRSGELAAERLAKLVSARSR